MKNVFVALSLLLGGAQANATSIVQTLTAQIESFHLDPASPLSAYNMASGSVRIDFLIKEIQVILQPAMNCPAGEICAAVMPAPLKNRAYLIRVEKDNCGNTIYVGKRDMSAVDGDVKEITVTDYTQNICPTFVALPSTEIVYRHSGYGRGEQYFDFTHHFTAGILRP